MALGERLRDLRKRYDMTQEQVANKLKIVRSTYAYYETGKTSPDFDTVVRLAHLFNVTTDYLLDADAKTTAVLSDSSQSSYNAAEKDNIGCQWPLRESEQRLLIAYRYLDKNLQKDFLKDIEKKAAERYNQHRQQKKNM